MQLGEEIIFQKTIEEDGRIVTVYPSSPGANVFRVQVGDQVGEYDCMSLGRVVNHYQTFCLPFTEKEAFILTNPEVRDFNRSWRSYLETLKSESREQAIN